MESNLRVQLRIKAEGFQLPAHYSVYENKERTYRMRERIYVI